jgi:uncharacterized protein DUF1501
VLSLVPFYVRTRARQSQIDFFHAPIPAFRPRQAGGGFGAVALTTLLAEDGFFARAAAESDNPLTPRPTHHPAKARAVICLFTYGGVGHLETFDPKPELNRRSGQAMPNLDRDPPFKIRHPGKLLSSLCKFRKYGLPS